MPRFARRFRLPGRLHRWRYVIFGCTAIAIIGLGIVIGFFVAAMRGLPSLANLEPNPALSSFVYDIKGNAVTDFSGNEERVPVKLEHVPQQLVDAFICAEDIRFWTHHGVDFRGIARALYRDITKGGATEGASTITQQFARNAFSLGYEKTITRKLQEIILAIQLERYYTKTEILEMYLNQIYFGHGAYGVQAASKTYFNKDVGDLTLPEAAMICGIAKNGNYYSPYVDERRALQRRNIVLEQMVRYGKISQAQATEAENLPLGCTGLPTENYPAAYFVDYVLEYLLDRYGADTVYRGGLKIYTTIDMDLQGYLEKAYKDILDPVVPFLDKDGNPLLDKNGKPQDVPQSAAVFMDPQTGQILAMLGGRNHTKRLELNRAVPPRGSWDGTLRQPGSAFKPLAVYAAAFDLGWSPSNVLDDSVKTWYIPDQPPFSPENYNRLYRGLVTLRQGVELSINTLAIKLIDQIGVETGVRYARKLGIDSLITEGQLIDASLAVAIGGLTQGVSVLDMTQAYCVFANGGFRVEPYAVIRVEDKYGNTLEQNEPVKQVALSEQATYLTLDTLRGVVNRGTGAGANIGRPAGGKTGTTDSNIDVWYIGFTPEICGAIWIGHDEPKEMKNVYGATYCAPMWKATVGSWLKDKPIQDWTMPDGIVRGQVCNKSGLLPGPNCPPSCVIEDLFIEGRQPMATCGVHTAATVCAARPWLLARPECPESLVKVFVRRPEPYEKFQRVDTKSKLLMTYVPADAANDLPTSYCDLHDPAPPSWPGVTLEVNLTATKFAFSRTKIEVPLGTYLVIKLQAVDYSHGFAVPSYGVDEVCLMGQQKTISFLCDKPGTFMFYSSGYAGEGTRGMMGSLVVGGG